MTDTAAPTQVARRPLMTTEGEPLLMASDSLEVVTRFQEFATLSGVPQDSILVDPVVSVPLPMYPQHFPEGLPRWEGTEPALMWHPLMWLPERLQARFMLAIEDENGDTKEQLEPDDIWAIRVVLELTQSGLYDANSGQWVDVLALAGLNIDDEGDLERVAAWLAGAEDPVLSTIDLSGFLMDDDEFALKEAANAAYGLRRAEWALLARDLADKLDEAMGYDATLTRVQGVSTVAMLAESTLASDEEGGSSRQLWKDAVDVCHQAIDNPGNVKSDAVATLADRLGVELTTVLERNHEWLDQLSEDVPDSAR